MSNDRRVGEIAHYYLTAAHAHELNEKTNYSSGAKVNAPHAEGQACAALVVAAHDAALMGPVALQVFVNGNTGSFWVPEARWGDKPGQYLTVHIPHRF